jgi:sugar/nucleoside kinase (ribokinase family)
MSTFLGASALFAPSDIASNDIAGASIVYLEGYLWDREEAMDAFKMAAALAAEHNRQTALTLSDAFCVDRHRQSFLQLIRNGVDIVFANEAELKSLYETSDFDEAIRQIGHDCQIAAITRSAKGSVIVNGECIQKVPAEPIDAVIDTTGAGDLYAAGFLFGQVRGKSLGESARLGHIAAAEIITHIGARPATKLNSLI